MSPLAVVGLALVVLYGILRVIAAHIVVTVLLVLLAAGVAACLIAIRTKQTAARRAIAQARTYEIAAYHRMDPKEFEHALAELCRRDGCTNVRVVGGAGDLAADVIATVPDGRRIIIQAKRFGPNTTVGSGDVQKVNGTYAAVHGGHVAAIVTTSRFTQPAAKLAHQFGIRAFDQHALAGWASRTGPAPWN